MFEASGTEIHFTSGFDPEPRARRIFNFPKAATLAKTLRGKDEDHPTWRGKVTARRERDALGVRAPGGRRSLPVGVALMESAAAFMLVYARTWRRKDR